MNTAKISTISKLPKINEDTNLILDTETTGLNKMKDVPFLILVTVGGKSWAVADIQKMIPWLNESMPKAKNCVFHNAKYDIHMLLNAGLKGDTLTNSNIWCSQVAETLLNDQRKSYSLDALCRDRFNIRKKDDEILEWLANEFGGKPTRKAQMNRISQAPIEAVAYYGMGDTEMTEMLFDAQTGEIDMQSLNQVMALEMRVLKSLVRMERRGVPVNMDTVERSLEKFTTLMDGIASKIENMVGFPVNVRSGKQLEEAFQALGRDVIYSDETGNPSFNKDVLSAMNDDLSKMILEQRSYKTMIDTFLSQFGNHIYSDGRIRCDFNQTKTDEYGVITGRLSASNPNMQQIPKRDGEKASIVRSVFEAPDGYKWMCADWKQFEFRVFAHYSKDPSLIAEFHRNPDADYHQIVADLTGLARNPYAKQLNLGLVFGMGQGLMAKHCNLPYTSEMKRGKLYMKAGPEAKAIFEKYHTALPNVRKMLRLAESTAIQRGYIKTISGRRIRFYGKNFSYKAGGYIFQGTSADMMKRKLVELDEAFNKTGIELMLSVHDEFDFLVPEGKIEVAKSVIMEIMENMPELRVPIRCDLGVGENWWEASK